MNKPCGLILIDGFDAQGKSTLARSLADTYNGIILHQNYRWKDRMFTYHTAALHHAIKKSETQLVILDRLWMSEDIYGKVYRSGSRWPHEGRFLDRILLKHAAINVICLANTPKIAARRHIQACRMRKELYGENSLEAAECYHNLYHGKATYRQSYTDDLADDGGMKSRLDVFPYRIEREGRQLPLFCRQLIYALQEWRSLQYQPALQPSTYNFSGHLAKAKYLFVGDQTNPKFRQVNWPFYEYGNCSLFLTKVLHEMNFDETRAVWINIHGQDGLYHVQEVLRLKPELKVIAFGKKAEQSLRKMGVKEIFAMPHPQWSRRFGGKYAEWEYEWTLKDLFAGPKTRTPKPVKSPLVGAPFHCPAEFLPH
jgi:thymidylate kinase